MTKNSKGLSDIKLRERPLIVCDIDEVALEFVTPFSAYLRAQGYELLPRSFRLAGNVVSLQDGSEASPDRVRAFLDSFFASQLDWQTPADAAAASLSALAEYADIVFLTAMPPRHYGARRALLDRHDMPFPLIATEDAKGPLIRDLHGARQHPIVFIDDILYNLRSVQEHVPQARTLQYMANEVFRGMAPDPGNGVTQAAHWSEIESIVLDHIGA